MKIFLFLLCFLCANIHGQSQKSSDFFVNIRSDSLTGYPAEVIVENQVFIAKFTHRNRFIKKFGDKDFCIRDWTLKSNGQDQIECCMDGSALRPFCDTARLLEDKNNRKVLEVDYGEFRQRYTFFHDKPYILVDYKSYKSDWFNTVDISEPGGLTERFAGETVIHGQDLWVRPQQYHESAFWSVHYDAEKEFYHIVDDSSAGSLNYRNHLIMIVLNPANGHGIGRVMPIQRTGHGGVRILKLLWDQGFETFPATGGELKENIPFRGGLFIFENGKEEGLRLGKQLVDLIHSEHNGSTAKER